MGRLAGDEEVAVRIRLVLVLATLLLAACGASVATTNEATPTDSASGMPDMGDGDGSFAFGEPGDPKMVDLTIRIDQLDPFQFTPEMVEVKAGETIRFVVSNRGATDHEFVIGDMAFQEQHESEMMEEGSGMMTSEPNAVVVAPGQSIDVFWRFTTPGTYVYGCHVSGHFAAGMKGEIKVA